LKRISPGKIEPKEYVKDGVNYVKPRQTENIIKITNRHISIMHISITRITNKLISSIIKITNRHISTVLPVIMRIIYNISMNISQLTLASIVVMTTFVYLNLTIYTGGRNDPFLEC